MVNSFHNIYELEMYIMENKKQDIGILVTCYQEGSTGSIQDTVLVDIRELETMEFCWEHYDDEYWESEARILSKEEKEALLKEKRLEIDWKLGEGHIARVTMLLVCKTWDEDECTTTIIPSYILETGTFLKRKDAYFFRRN